MNIEEIIEELKKESTLYPKNNEEAKKWKKISKSLEIIKNDLELLSQIKRERDIAVKQLNDLGYGFGKETKKRWIKEKNHRRCPRCGYYSCIRDEEGDEIPDKFCPNCGTKVSEK